MALLRTTTKMKMREIFRPSILSPGGLKGLFHGSLHPAADVVPLRVFMWRGISYRPALCAAAKKAPARMSKVQEFLLASNEHSQAGGSENIPQINLDHLTVGFARSGGVGGGGAQNIVQTKFEMRFNVRNADWLSDKVKKRILQMERNRINKNGELVISSTKSPAHKNNFDDAIAKLQLFTRLLKKFQEIIDAASYVPPPTSKETVEKITKLSEQKCVGLSGINDLEEATTI